MNKKHRGGKPGRVPYEWLMLGCCIAAFLLALLLPLTAIGLTGEEWTLARALGNGEVIRLHILAKDNSPEAQALKLTVRDAVLDAFGSELAAAGVQDADAAYALLEAKREQILITAQAAAAENGCSDPIRAEVGWLDLPEKQYGEILLPAGAYRGLRLVIGEGKGENWWCVLFPRLCLALAGAEPQQEPVRWEWYSLRILSLWPAVAPMLPEQPLQ
jgi:stage II sporulation protein R